MYKYNFTYKDAAGEMGKMTIEVTLNDVEEAIAKFEYTYPELVWRAVEKL